MYSKVKNLVKYNKAILFIYRVGMTLFAKTMSLFVKVDDKKILFMSFGGKRFDDSSKVLYEKIKKDDFFKDYKFVWGFIKPEEFDTGCDKVKTDTIKYYKTLLSSKIWISNSNLERGLHLKNSKYIEVNTWHGTPLKKMGCDVEHEAGYQNKKLSRADIFCAQSKFDRDIWARIFDTENEKILICDLPRNDILAHYTSEDAKLTRHKLGLPDDKKIILYTPTFREFNRDKDSGCVMELPINAEKWKNELSDKYIMLVRIHYEVSKAMGIRYDDFFRDVSDYPDLNELMTASDCLLSDYSSIYFDYAITQKPMLNFSYDLEEYKSKRGMYFDLKDVLPCNINLDEDGIISELKALDFDEYSSKTRKFKERFAPNAGNAANSVIARLKKLIDEDKAYGK